MTAFSLVKTRIQAGIWEGVLSGGTDDDIAPALEVVHREQPIKTIAVIADEAAARTWSVKIAIPPDLLADGVQTFLIRDKQDGETLGSFAVLAGEALEDDIRAELDLLRAELDMLKRAFRRHCLETM